MSFDEVTIDQVTVQQRPSILLKLAASLDGFIDDSNPTRAIFSDESDRTAVLSLRSSADAVAIGAGTLRSDNPTLQSLGSSQDEPRKDPIRVIFSKRGDIPLQSRIFSTVGGEIIVFCLDEYQRLLAEKLQGKATVVAYPNSETSLASAVAFLGSRGVRKVLVEGGSELGGSLLRAGLVDLVRIAFAPFFLGNLGRVPLVPRVVGLPDQETPMNLVQIDQIGRMAVGWFIPAGKDPATVSQWK